MNTLFQRVVFATIFAFLVAPQVRAQSETFGHTFLDGSPSSGMTGDFKRGSKFRVTQPGVLTSFTALLDGFGGPQSGYQEITLALYRDANGVPGIKVVESASVRIAALAEGRQRNFYTPATPLPPGDYWIVIHSAGSSGGSTPGIVRNSGRGGIANWYGNSDAFADGASSPFGAGNSGTVELIVWGHSLTESMLKVAGRNTIAATPSSGLTSNFKRGARFTLAENARLTHLSAYLDGNGGGSGMQKLRYVLYRDSGGVPTSKVIESSEVTVKSGQSGSWVTGNVPVTTLVPGNYWIMIHSGDTGGIARDFGDGAANWYGNSDSYADGAATTFGSGNTGSGTISAAAIYIPGTAPAQTFGRDTIATTPSNGLTADYIRGSEFSGYLLSGMVTSFWAYLDGNGGASGSQNVRVAVYQDYAFRDDPDDKVYESEVVSIPAGMSPRWVRFPLKAPLPLGGQPGFWLTLHTGGTPGVIRDYGDGADNWLGTPDTFADGAAETLDPFHDPNATRGTGTLSIYAEINTSNPTTP